MNRFRSVPGAFRRVSGVTLIELVIALSIVAILSLIAFPGYQDYQQRARRAEAKSALLRLATNQERFYIQNRTYTADLAQLGFATNETRSGYYVVSVSAADTLGFQAMAIPAAGSPQTTDTDCLQFRIDDQSDRIAAPDPNGDCW